VLCTVLLHDDQDYAVVIGPTMKNNACHLRTVAVGPLALEQHGATSRHYFSVLVSATVNISIMMLCRLCRLQRITGHHTPYLCLYTQEGLVHHISKFNLSGLFTNNGLTP